VNLSLLLKYGPTLLVLLSCSWLSWEWRDRAADIEAQVHANELQALRLEAAHAQLLASRQVRARERATAERLQAIEEAAALRTREREVVTVYVTEEVVRYAESPAVPRFAMPAAWVRLHDIAAASTPGMPPAAFAPELAYGTAGPITDAGALAVTAGNYASCNATREQLIDLQAWVRAALNP
jgi:hypothetical protein